MSEENNAVLENDACKVTRGADGDILITVTAFQRSGGAAMALPQVAHREQFKDALRYVENKLLQEYRDSPLKQRNLIIDFDGAQAAPYEILREISETAEVLQHYNLEVSCRNIGYGIKSGFRSTGHPYLGIERTVPTAKLNGHSVSGPAHITKSPHL